MQILDFLKIKTNSKLYADMKSFHDENIIEKDDDPDVYYLYKKDGLSIVTDEEYRINAIHLYSEGKDGYSQYSKDIPNDISFNSSQKNVRAKLGNPNRSGGDYEDKLLGYIAPWDSYYFDNYTIHISYKKDTNSINMITMMIPEATPGRITE